MIEKECMQAPLTDTTDLESIAPPRTPEIAPQ